jgi:hypothetical protein
LLSDPLDDRRFGVVSSIAVGHQWNQGCVKGIAAFWQELPHILRLVSVSICGA